MTTFQLPVQIETRKYSSQGIDILYPQKKYSHYPMIQEKINRKIYQEVVNLYHTQQPYQIGTQLEMIGRYEIKTNERGILSLILSNYAYSRPMAHGMTFATPLTFNLKTGENVKLSALFKDDTNYTEVISKLIKRQIKERDIPLIEEFDRINPDQTFYLADKSIVIFFSLYEYTPYYVGFPMFPISLYQLETLAPEDGIISRLTIPLV
ncbi:DUF3298 and DUF4163 domain-containing protein [Bacillus shivajii]|uniref:DUF3298 and DUF4163 domain-containing protein n=1 Tax=Bacillus shivajii TaxID=1983719 RepID=UPI001CFA8A0F|nr:DUF3298 and DUF4163 domain-containing protein [Bacillus shivajii]UCZ55147.1 DUF3298 and DUF4163 domain-containing protein [Bacillus shivajii]